MNPVGKFFQILIGGKLLLVVKLDVAEKGELVVELTHLRRVHKLGQSVDVAVEKPQNLDGVVQTLVSELQLHLEDLRVLRL